MEKIVIIRGVNGGFIVETESDLTDLQTQVTVSLQKAIKVAREFLDSEKIDEDAKP